MTRSKQASTEAWGLSAEDRALVARFVDRVRAIREIQAVILFGSFARGDADRGSDIDLLVVSDTRDPGALRPRLARIVTEIKPHREINPIATNLRDLDPSFLRTVLQEGKVVHGKLVVSPDRLGLEPRVLVAYDLSGMKPSQKVRVSRLVHGFESRKVVRGRRRTYRYPGLRERYGATFISPSVLLLKPEDAAALARELEDAGVPFDRWNLYL